MGQYYAAVLDMDGKPVGYESKEPGYRKLTEHSWWLNGYVNAVAKIIFGEPHRIAWVGDYAAGIAPCTKRMYAAAHRKDTVLLDDETEFNPDDTFLVNHSKRQYIDCNKYFAAVNGRHHLGEGCVFHILPLITAIGNGASGDYFGVNRDLIGMWAWDKLSFELEIPDGYTEIDVPIWYE